MYNASFVIMWLIQTVIICIILSDATTTDLSFPPEFKFGAASSAYQVEGAWDRDGKGPSIWDWTVHNRRDTIEDNSTGDDAGQSYYLYEEDARIAQKLGLDMYRFSISWSRILPSGYTNSINMAGVNYYNNLINALLVRGVEPVITLYHWDLPMKLQELGGWTNPLISDLFADYANLVFSFFADRVKIWLTINEGFIMCDFVYNYGQMSPNIQDVDRSMFYCNKNILLAHAKAWRIYHKFYKPLYNGKVSLPNQLVWFDAVTPEDEREAELARQFIIGRYCHPIYSAEGGWPKDIEEIIAGNSRRQGYLRSKLPPFTQEEVDLIRGTYDFFAFNHYLSMKARRALPGEKMGYSFIESLPDINVKLEAFPIWKVLKIGAYPEGLRKLLRWLKKTYGDLPYMVTECGYSENALEDDSKIDYISTYMLETLKAIKEDGVRVTGFTVWSMIDTMEWNSGYQPKFGLFQVNYSDPLRARIPRKSAHYYQSVIRARSLRVPLMPDTWIHV